MRQCILTQGSYSSLPLTSLILKAFRVAELQHAHVQYWGIQWGKSDFKSVNGVVTELIKHEPHTGPILVPYGSNAATHR